MRYWAPRFGHASPYAFETARDDFFEALEAAVGEVAGDAFRADLVEWLDRRRDQLEAAELLYLTHQLDVLGQVRMSSPGERDLAPSERQ